MFQVNTFKSHRTKWLTLAAATTVLGLALVACGPTDDPKVENPCADDASLCIPRQTLIDSGRVVFENCTGCHGMEAHGYAGATPPLANSDFFMNNRNKVIKIVLGGYDSLITVNGLHYQGTMPNWSEYLSDFKIASVLTFLRTQRNDSLIVSCDTTQFDDDGFAKCTKTARTPSEIAADSVAVWEVARIRDSLGLPDAQP